MSLDFTEIDAVILDLGGVILNIDYDRTINAFKQLGFPHFEEQYSKMQQSGLFDRLEKGLIDQEAFVSAIQEVLPTVSAAEILAAWNAMLLDFPEGRIGTLKQIAAWKPLLLLSNTNTIHYEAFTKKLQQQTGLNSLKPLFVEAFLSHELHMRKPDKEVFQHIIDKHNLQASRTLFVDDSPQHLEGAREVGLKTYHMEAGDRLEALFAPILA